MNIDNDELWEAEYKLQNCIRVTPDVESYKTEVNTGKRWVPVTEYVLALLAAQRQALRDEVLAAIGEPNELRDYDYKFGPAAFKNQPIRHEKWQKDVLRDELRTAISTIFEGKEQTNAS